MKLATRFLVAALVPVVCIILGNGFLRVQREVELLTDEVARHHHAMGRALAAAIETAAAATAHATDAATGAPTLDAVAERLLSASASREGLIALRWRPAARLSAADNGDVALTPEARAALFKDLVFTSGTPGTDTPLLTLVPVTVDGALRGVIEMREKLDHERAYIRDTWARVGANTAVAAFAVALVISLTGWWLIARRVRGLLALVGRMDEADVLADEMHLFDADDELGRVAREIRRTHGRLADARARLADETESRIRAVEQLRHADRLVTVGQLAGGMAHELGTPLNVVLGRARMIQSGVSEERQREYLDVIVRQVDRISGIIRQVLGFSRRNPPAKTAADLSEIVVETTHLLAPMAKKSGVTVDVERVPVRATVDPLQVEQVVTNLLMNAIQACADDGKVRVSTGVGRGPKSGPGPTADAVWAFVRVEDDGPGIAPDVVERVFDPFFTTKDVGEGTGLGLSVAYGIVSEHGGSIEVESAPDAGATFTAWLPGAPEAHSQEEENT